MINQVKIYHNGKPRALFRYNSEFFDFSKRLHKAGCFSCVITSMVEYSTLYLFLNSCCDNKRLDLFNFDIQEEDYHR